MSVVAWGFGKSGALGTTEATDRLYPVVVGGELQGKHVVGVACGEHHSLAVDDLGMVYAWGRNKEGQCGQGFLSPVILTPTRIDALLHERIVKVIAGSHQSFAITDDGKLYRWGLFHERALNTTPQYFGLRGVRQISQETQEMIDRSHYLYFSNKTSTEEFESEVETVQTFRRRSFSIPEILDVEGKKTIQIAAGYCFYLIVTDDGSLYSFGFNDKGQLGLGNRYSQEAPKRVTGVEEFKIIDAIAGQQHSVVLTDKGKVASWGGGVFGLGHGDGEDHLVPKFIEALNNVDIVQMACGTYHTFVVSSEGEIYSFGHGEYGQQGTGDLGERGEQTRNALSPRLMDHIPWNAKIKSIQCGHLHTLFILDDGSIWTCGWGTCGVLGHGDQKYRLNPTQIKSLEGEIIHSASGGWKHNIAIKAGSNTFALDFEKILANLKKTDITFYVDKKPIHAHRSILSSRCSVIRAMIAFHSRFVRNGNYEFKIPGPRFVVFKAMINFLYTDHLNVAPFFAPEVAQLALFFRLPRLEGLAKQLLFRVRHESVQLPPSTFSEDFVELIENPIGSDVSFSFSNESKVIRAHKMILTARCPYFKTLFEGGHFKDSEVDFIDLDSCPVNSDSFFLVLKYIYTGNREIANPENALELLAAADYFLMDDLKRVCEDVVEKNMDNDKEALESIKETAEIYGAKRLIHHCSRAILGF